MTLLEVVLALAITSLFFCCLLNLTASGVNMQQREVEQARLRRQMHFIRLFVQDQFDKAKCVSFYEENGELRKIVFDEEHTLHISKEKIASSGLYKMIYERKVVADCIESMTFWQREHWGYIRCTLVGKGSMRLTEDMILNRMYKTKEGDSGGI